MNVSAGSKGQGGRSDWDDVDGSWQPCRDSTERRTLSLSGTRKHGSLIQDPKAEFSNHMALAFRCLAMRDEL